MASFDEVVPPGKAGTIRVRLHTSNYTGTIGKTVTVTHDDPTQGALTLSFSANIVGSVNVLPHASLQLGTRLKGFGTPARLIVRKDPTERGTLAVDGLVASASWLKVTSRRVTGDERPGEGVPAALPGDFVVSAQVDAPPVGSHAESITFRTGLPREPQVKIPVLVMVQPAVVLQPNDLRLNPKPGASAEATGQVLASIREDLDPKSLVVSSDASAFSVRVDPPGERAFRLIVDWEEKGENSPTETKIHVRAGGETVELPVRVMRARTQGTP